MKLRQKCTHGGPQRRSFGVVGVVVGLAAVVALTAACGADDRELRQPSPDQTTSSSSIAENAETAPSDAVGTDPEAALELTSPAFEPGGVIPDQYTCRGGDISPPLEWANLPAGVVELALVVRDPDAGGFVHWVVAGLSPAAGGLPEGQVPEGAVEAANDFGRVGWAGPCPPSGTHRYELHLLALSEPPALEGVLDAQTAAQTVESSPPLATALLTGTVTAG
jgi:Raf kinase inhibitor-like YbhB/YbcL family protein